MPEDTITRMEAHETLCAERYSSIERRLDDGAQRFNKLERMLWMMYPMIISIFAVAKWIQ